MHYIKRVFIPIYNFFRFLKTEPDFIAKLFELKTNEKKIVLLGTPIHGNIGDHLIAESEKIFFQKRFPDYRLIECTMPFSRYFLSKIIYNIHLNDFLVISGGGWLGSEWRIHEVFVRKILSNFSVGNLVILPQTVYYASFDQFAKDGIEVYRKNKDFLFCVRDKSSYDFLINHHYCSPDKLFYMPDFALAYPQNQYISTTRKKRINICLRDDIERSINADIKKEIIASIHKYDNNPKMVTTNTKGLLIKPTQRSFAIECKIKEISDCELLITDRLHAMIIAVLSGTPCLVFDNSTHKVAGVYEWIKELDYIHMYKEGELFDDVINQLLLCRNNKKQYDFASIRDCFDKLYEKIKSMEGITHEHHYS